MNICVCIIKENKDDKERKRKEGKGRGEQEKEGEGKEAMRGRGEGCKKWLWGRGLYPPPQIPCGGEDFTLPHRFHVESMWSPGQSPESMWTLDIFFLVVAQPIFCPESMWTPCGVRLDSSCSIWTTWTPPRNTGNISKTPYGVHMDSLHLLVLCYLLYKIKKCMGKD